MKLYEIDAEIEQCILIDEETGEVIGIDTERADKLQMMRDDKIKNSLILIEYLRSDKYRYLGENYNYADLIKTKENGAKEKIVGEWRGGE